MADAKQQQAVAPSAAWMTVKPFVNGGASGMLATCVIQPIDMVKVRPPCSGRTVGPRVAWLVSQASGFRAAMCGGWAGCGRDMAAALLWAGSCCCTAGFEI